MKTSTNGINLIKSFEGCKLTAYKCSAGVPTIGYGHTAGVKMGQKITQAQADAYLRSDLAKFETNVNKFYPIYKWNQNEFDALVSFAYNLGSINKLINNGNYNRATIRQKWPNYCHAAGKIIPGLQKRRLKELGLFNTSISNRISSNTTTTTTTSSAKKSVNTIAAEVVAGKWGSGADRKKKLEAAGYNYAQVQAAVNSLASPAKSNKKSVNTIAAEVVAGKWGSGADRKKKIEAAGYNYAQVQSAVNALMK